MTNAATEWLRMDGVSVLGASADDEPSVLRLDDVRLTLAPGEWLYIVGVNGSGKSTLARLLAGLFVEGAYGQMSRGFAGETSSPIVLQQPETQLFGETPREEVQFALEWRQWPAERISSRTDEALRRVGLAELAYEPWEGLSGGQRQLAAFAAASAVDAPLLVLDEATSMLDEANRGTLAREARRRQREGAAVVWVTQRLEELEPDARVVAIRDGRVVFDGEARGFLYGGADGEASPCEQAGLRLPYGVRLARELRQRRERGASAETGVPAPAGVRGDDAPGGAEAERGLPLRVAGLRRGAGVGAEAASREDALTLAPGTLTLLIGGNGVGKTTLLEKLAGLRPAEGLRVAYGEEPVCAPGRMGRTQLNAKALLRYSYAPQSPENGLFSRTVEEELRYSARPYDLREDALLVRMSQALSGVGWDESWLPRDPYRMSGGERRRAALAAAFTPPAPWLLLDEPTAGLDGEGHERLAMYLQASKARGVGIVLISHDLDWALPLAEAALIMDAAGDVRYCSRDELLTQPETLLAEAGLVVPPWLRAAHALLSRGVPAELVWPPEEAAAEAVSMGIDVEGVLAQPASNVKAVQHAGVSRRGVKERLRHRLGTFDPRTIWLSYVLLSIGIFAQRTWVGVVGAAVVTVILLAAGRISLWRWRKLLQTYAAFSVIASAFFAVGLNDQGLTFKTDSFVGTLLPFSRTYVVLLLGLCIPLVMTPLSLRNALQKLLSFRGRTPRLAHRLILTVTVMIRFIPVLVGEWGRFSRIHLSRGKRKSGGLWTIARKMRDMSLPFLLSLFRLGDEIAVALESRGVAADKRPTRTAALRWRGRDYAFVAGASAVAAALWAFASS